MCHNLSSHFTGVRYSVSRHCYFSVLADNVISIFVTHGHFDFAELFLVEYISKAEIMGSVCYCFPKRSSLFILIPVMNVGLLFYYRLAH